MIRGQRVAGAVAAALALLAGAAVRGQPGVRWIERAPGDWVVAVDGSVADCERRLTVRIVEGAIDAPPVAGRCARDGSRVVFRPLFPLMAGSGYTAALDGHSAARLDLPPLARIARAAVRIFPSADVLPANQLKLYLEFSAPMTIGEAQRRVHLLDAGGTEVRHAFLAVDDEMWDAERRRLTVLFEPGRVKRGLKANLQSGAPLREGGAYTLTIDREWPDACGAPLVAGATKRFTVAAADRQAPLVPAWTVEAPVAGTLGDLRVVFDDVMDYGVALRALAVAGERGENIDGAVTLEHGERAWRFTPRQPWRDARYSIAIDPRIEDRAGNNLMRLFDADLRDQPATADEGVRRLTFAPRRGTSPGATASLPGDSAGLVTARD